MARLWGLLRQVLTTHLTLSTNLFRPFRTLDESLLSRTSATPLFLFSVPCSESRTSWSQLWKLRQKMIWLLCKPTVTPWRPSTNKRQRVWRRCTEVRLTHFRTDFQLSLPRGSHQLLTDRNGVSLRLRLGRNHASQEVVSQDNGLSCWLCFFFFNLGARTLFQVLESASATTC